MTMDNPIETQIKTENAIHYRNGEISLVDLYMILVRRRKIIIVTMVLVLLTAIVYLLLVTPVYEGKAVIQVGQVGQVGQIEDLGKLKVRLKIEYPSIERIDSQSNFVTITSYAHTKADIKQRLKKITEQLIKKHNIIYNTKMAGQQQKLEFLRKRIDDMHSEIEEFSKLINTLIRTEPSQATILVLEKNKLKQNLPGLEEKAMNLNQSKMRSTRTKIFREPTVIDKPLKPKAKLIIALSIVLGLMAGIFFAFVIEFITKTRQKTKVTENKLKAN